MADQEATGVGLPDLAERVAALQRIAEKSKRVSELWLSPPDAGGIAPLPVPYSLGQNFIEVAARLTTDPRKLAQTHVQLWRDYLALWQQTTQRMLGQTAEPIAPPEKGDRRFKHTDWDRRVAGAT